MGQGEAVTEADVAPGRDDPNGGSRPRVVVIVTGRAPAVVAEPPALARSPLADTARIMPGATEDQPTTRIRQASASTRPRGPEDERLVAAVVPLDWSAEPGPLADFLGRSLLFRAARAAAHAGAPRLILVGRVPEHLRRRVYDEAYAGFMGKPVELVEGDPTEKDLGGRGRALVLDSRALHDPEAVQRLAQARGGRAVLLLGRWGDGLRVRTSEGRVVETGSGLENADGRVAGACSVPVETFVRLCGVGELAALENLGSSEELVAVVAPRTFSQQFASLEAFRRAQELFFDRIAGGGGGGLFDELFGSRLSRRLTMALLHSAVTPASVSVLAALVALLGAWLIAIRDGWGAVAGGGLLILSAVLDRVDGELARLRLDEDEAQRYLDFGLDHLTHMLAFLALAWTVHRNRELSDVGRLFPQLGQVLERYDLGPMVLGSVAAAGVIFLFLVLVWRGMPTSEPQPALTRLGDFMAASFGSRDYFYMLLIATAVAVAVPHAGVLGFFLVLTTALVHLVWLSLAMLTAISPRHEG